MKLRRETSALFPCSYRIISQSPPWSALPRGYIPAFLGEIIGNRRLLTVHPLRGYLHFRR